MRYQELTLNKKNIKDFAEERNKLLEKTKSEWVFFVDSDEKVSPELKKELDHLTIKPSDHCFYVIRKNFFLGQFVGEDKIIRLVKNGSGKWERAVHEIWKPYKTHSRSGLSGYLIHNTADNLSTYLKKINNYSTLHALENKKEGKTSNVFIIIFFPVFKFIQTYFKSKHIVFSIMASLHSFLSWSKQYLKENEK